MAVGRISGPLLKSNLIRNGIDLAFETDLLYLDVNNQRIGVKNSTPEYEVDVNGTTKTTDLIVTSNADIADINISGSTISTTAPYLNLGTLDNIVALNKIRIDSIDIEGNAITTNNSNANLEFRPNGVGAVNVHSDLNVDGNIHATGNISADGNINIGDANTDNVTFNAEVASSIIPDQDDTYSLGSDPDAGGKSWNNVWTKNLVASSVNGDAGTVDGISLTLVHGNIIHVAENGNDDNVGEHYLDPYATIKYALSQAVSGDTVYVSPGVYTEVFPLTIPTGVTLRGEGIRAVTIQPTTETRYNDAVLLNGETTVEELTIKDFYSGGNFYTSIAPHAPGTVTVNVGPTDVAHTYVSGGTITFAGNEYNITNAVYNNVTGLVTITHVGPDAGFLTEVFLKDITFSCNNDTRIFPDNGYAFRYATDYEALSRSPYIRNITVITKGSVTSVSDPRGYDAGDAGKGAYIDGAYGTASTVNTALLFHSATFITPGVDAITMTNGARVEWLNSFTYFANRSLYAYDSKAGRRYTGKTKLALGGVTGTFTQGNTLTLTSTDGSTVLTGTISSVDGTNVYIDGYLDLNGFDLTPQSITDGSATATSITNFDLREFGAEVRLIASASVYGNQGLVGQGPGVIMYAIGHNLAYIGNGKAVDNNPATVIQANEVVESEGAKIRYNSVDHKGDFRVGDLFYVNQETGNVTFAVSDFTIDTENGVTFNTNGSSTLVDGTKIETGDWRISGNTIETLTQNANFTAATGEVNINSNVNITGSLDVTGNVTIGGNITIGDEETDTIQIIAGIDSDITPKFTSTHSLGQVSKTWKNLYVNEIILDNISIRDNFIETTESNSDLELRANGTGEIYMPTNDVVIEQDLTVNGVTTLQNTNINGDFTLTGDFVQQGNTVITGTLFVQQDLIVTGAAQLEEILIDDNIITTTTSSTDLDLRASGTGEIYVPYNDVLINENLTVVKNITANNLTTIGSITANKFTTENIVIDDNYITTTDSNSDLELRANGTGSVRVPNNDVLFENNFTVQGTSTLSDTVIQGELTQVGNTTQTGNINITGAINVIGNVTVSDGAQFENINIDDNIITTTVSNSDLELRATEYGNIIIPTNNVEIANDLTVTGTINVTDIVSSGAITANRFTTGDIVIDDNFVTTTLSNSDLELRANGTGNIRIPSNNTILDQNLTVNGSTNLKNTTIVGDITHTGNVTQVGDINLTGNLDVTGEVIITATVISFEQIALEGNSITTTDSNANLELRANGTGRIFMPSNDVEIQQNLDIRGTITVGNVTSTDTVAANRFTTGNILIDDNFITTTVSNSDLELRAAGTGSIIIDTFDINGTTITTSGDMVLQPGSQVLNINAVGAMTIPVGDTSQRPTATQGQLRFNSELARFEGYNGTNWVNIKGVQDLDGDTRVTAELTEGLNDNIIRFDIAGSTVVTINNTRLAAPKINVDDIEINGNLITTTTANKDLLMTANGTGSVKFDNFAFKDNTITNYFTDSITLFENSGDGYVKFDGSYGIVIPSGGAGARPPIEYTELGQVRYNTDDNRVEVYDGVNWVSVAGSASGITRNDAEEIALATVLVLG